MRITRQQMFMEMAEAAAKRSTCFRLNVGAIIVRANNVVSIGYNGPPSGEPHCSGNVCPGRSGCTIAVHAEQNAINRALCFLSGTDLYVTDSPCQQCCDLIIKRGIRRLFFRTPYRVIEPVNELIKYCQVYRLTPAGSVIEWESKDFVELDQ